MENLLATIHPPGTYKGRIYKGDEELGRIADKVVELLCAEGLPIWQAKEVLKLAGNALEWQTLK